MLQLNFNPKHARLAEHQMRFLNKFSGSIFSLFNDNRMQSDTVTQRVKFICQA